MRLAKIFKVKFLKKIVNENKSRWRNHAAGVTRRTIEVGCEYVSDVREEVGLIMIEWNKCSDKSMEV